MKIKKLICLCFTFIWVSVFSQDIDYQLHIAAEKGDAKEVLHLIRLGADVNKPNLNGVTALMYAAENGHLNIVKILLDKGAEPNKIPDNGVTALIATSKAGYIAIAEKLIQNGAYVNSVDKQKSSALHYAAWYGDKKFVDLLLAYNAVCQGDIYKITPFMISAYHGDTAILPLYFKDSTLNINRQDNFGYTALMYAVENNKVHSVNYLIENKADVNIKANNNLSAMAIAARNCNDTLVKILIDAGAEVNYPVNSQITPLILTTTNGCSACKKTLKNAGAKQNFTPHFTGINIGFVNHFNFDDYMLGTDFSLLEQKYGITSTLCFLIRPYNRRTLYEKDENTIYQYKQNTGLFFGEVDKYFYYKKTYIRQAAFFLGGKANFVFKTIKATNIKPGGEFIFSPVVGYYRSSDNFSLTLKYEYLDLNQKAIDFNESWFLKKYYNSPHRISISLSGKIRLTKHSSFVKRSITNYY